MSKSKSPEETLEQLLTEVTTLHISSIRVDGSPNISYSPYVIDNDGAYCILISQLASHTEDLLNNPKVSIMLIEDEQDTRQIYARTRLTYFCDVEKLEKKDPHYEEVLDLMSSKFGSIINTLRELPDFVMFRLVPEHGRFVMGFGQAYRLENGALQGFKALNGDKA